MKRAAALVFLAAALAGCASSSKAPVIDRAGGAAPAVASEAPAAPGALALPSLPDARPETYTVKPGDTLYSIALNAGLDYRELASWNGITDPGVIRVGQMLQLRPPSSDVQVNPLAGSGSIEARPLESPPLQARPLDQGGSPSAGVGASTLKTTPKVRKLPYSEENLAAIRENSAAPAPAIAKAEPKPEPREAKVDPKLAPKPEPKPELLKPEPRPAQNPELAAEPDRVDWAWPVTGKVLAGFSEATNKGVDIAGKLGDAVFASASGRVVYSGQGLRGYGKLIIIKHNNTYLSAYAHNNNLLVREGQTVVKGQKIAEMGNSDAASPKLHFEIRRMGKPVDPLKFLPDRPS